MSLQKQNYNHLVYADGTYGVDIQAGITPGEGGQKGHRGDKGDDGAKGQKGIEGDQGNTGTKGQKGQQGVGGAAGPDGLKGQKGTDSELFTYKGSKADLPAIEAVQNPEVGDVYNAQDSNILYAWNGATWGSIGSADAVKGEAGTKGQKGLDGVDGVDGDKGQKGLGGTDGTDGAKGQKGDDGLGGEKGVKGQKGLDGDGDKGAQGVKGQKGHAGDKGDLGTKGQKGEVNDKGEKGDDGTTGDKGQKGVEPDKGEKGQKGADSAINNQWTGTLNGSAGNPSTRITATGQYWKAGRFVFISIRFNNFNSTGYGGNITLSGLPFAATSDLNAGYAVGSVWHDGIMINGENHADDDTEAYLSRGSSTIRFITSHVPINVENNWITSDHASMIVSMSYFTDLT
jgi:hypothetical protein